MERGKFVEFFREFSGQQVSADFSGPDLNKYGAVACFRAGRC